VKKAEDKPNNKFRNERGTSTRGTMHVQESYHDGLGPATLPKQESWSRIIALVSDNNEEYRRRGSRVPISSQAV
jgi:hypothetical protein